MPAELQEKFEIILISGDMIEVKEKQQTFESTTYNINEAFNKTGAVEKYVLKIMH